MGSRPVGRFLGRSIRKIVLGKDLLFVTSPSGYSWRIVIIQIDTTVEYSSTSYKRAYQHCVYFMSRWLHLSAILYVLICGWPLRGDRVLCLYLHILLLLLRLSPRSN